jgi:hypothetical protein
MIPPWVITATGPGAGQVGEECLQLCPACRGRLSAGGMKSRSFAATGRCRNCQPRLGVMKQVCEDARIAVGDLYYLGPA